MQQHPEWIAYLVFVLDLAIRIGLSLRILMRSNTVGVTFAWMTIVLAVPYLGALLYLLIGERRLGEHRIGRARQVIEQSRPWRSTLCQQASREAMSIYPPATSRWILHARKIIGLPLLPGNSLTLLQRL